MSTTSHVTINSDIEDDTVTDKICEYPPHVEGRVSIHIADLKSLEENEYLNDQIISKCFRFIVIFCKVQLQLADQEKQNKFTQSKFDIFFLHKLFSDFTKEIAGKMKKFTQV